MNVPASRCGYVAIVGRPNVGKSTLLNHLLGQKLSITSRKPQTTRHNLLGIRTEGPVQTVYVDTPGQHLGRDRAINRYMNESARTAMNDVDVVVFMVDKQVWNDEDEQVARHLRQCQRPVILAVNKVDQVKHKEALLPHVEALAERLSVEEIVPISALRKHNLDRLQALIEARLPEGPHLFEEDQVTDRSMRFIAAERVREKLTRQLGAELPYQATVEIEEYREEPRTTFISALILVERTGQKQILVGEKGARIKRIGEEARRELEDMLESRVMLRLWVKVKSGWSDDERALRSLGYHR